MKEERSKFVLVDCEVLPEVFLKVIEVKTFLQKGKAKTIGDAVTMAGISRSAYYKYKESVFPFYEMSAGKTLTLFLVVEDTAGNLSEVLNRVAAQKANILTINQHIPINGVANITLTLQTAQEEGAVENLLENLHDTDGVQKIEILALA